MPSGMHPEESLSWRLRLCWDYKAGVGESSSHRQSKGKCSSMNCLWGTPSLQLARRGKQQKMGLPWLWSRLLYLHRGLSGMDKVSQEKSGQGAHRGLEWEEEKGFRPLWGWGKAGCSRDSYGMDPCSGGKICLEKALLSGFKNWGFGHSWETD